MTGQEQMDDMNGAIGTACADLRVASLRDIGFDIARIAHWTKNDRGYTRQMIARDLARIAKKLLKPELYAQVIGDAAAPEGTDA